MIDYDAIILAVRSILGTRKYRAITDALVSSNTGLSVYVVGFAMKQLVESGQLCGRRHGKTSTHVWRSEDHKSPRLKQRKKTLEAKLLRKRKSKSHQRDTPAPKYFTPAQYAEALKHPAWKKLRAIMLRKRGYKCQLCAFEHGLVVHHIGYKQYRWPEDYPYSNFMVVCGECHDELHADKPKTATRRRGYDNPWNL